MADAESVEEEEEEGLIEDLFSKNTESFRCLAQILISRSSLLRHPLYPFPPLPVPDLDGALNYTESPPPPDTVRSAYYLQRCKELDIAPLRRVVTLLPTKELNLKYCGLTEKQTRAVTETLKGNEYVKILNLQDNWMTPKAVQYISNMLIENKTINVLNLYECRIGPEGARNLKNGLLRTKTLFELDLSFNDIGDLAIKRLEVGLEDNNSIKKLNLSHNDLGSEESATILGRIMENNTNIEDLDISWNSFYTDAGTVSMAIFWFSHSMIKKSLDQG